MEPLTVHSLMPSTFMDTVVFLSRNLYYIIVLVIDLRYQSDSLEMQGLAQKMPLGKPHEVTSPTPFSFVYEKTKRWVNLTPLPSTWEECAQGSFCLVHGTTVAPQIHAAPSLSEIFSTVVMRFSLLRTSAHEGEWLGLAVLKSQTGLICSATKQGRQSRQSGTKKNSYVQCVC